MISITLVLGKKSGYKLSEKDNTIFVSISEKDMEELKKGNVEITLV